MKRVLFAIALLFAASSGKAHEGCQCQLQPVGTELEKTDWIVSVTETFSQAQTLQRSSEKRSNPRGQYLDTSITTPSIQWNATEEFSVSFQAPMIYRAFRRPAHERTDEGNFSGMGDGLFICRYEPLVCDEDGVALRGGVSAGVKLPTGSSHRLQEELRSHHHDDEEFDSAIHGHDLALGSGSFDAVLGLDFSATSEIFYGRAGIVYFARTQGDFGYQFGDTLIVAGGPGAFLYRQKDCTVGLEGIITYDLQQSDTFRDRTEMDTGASSIFAGPSVVVVLGDGVEADLGADFPVDVANRGLQIIADYRIHGGVRVGF
jgi:hypothetical protein